MRNLEQYIKRNFSGKHWASLIVITEDCEFSPGLVDGDYAKSKATATELVFAAAERGLNTSIVFPSGIIGPGDLQGGSFTSMAKSFLAGKLPLAVRGGYDFVDVRDVANGILACSESGEPGKGYILSGHYVTIRKMLQLVGKAAKLKYLANRNIVAGQNVSLAGLSAFGAGQNTFCNIPYIHKIIPAANSKGQLPGQKRLCH